MAFCKSKCVNYSVNIGLLWYRITLLLGAFFKAVYPKGIFHRK